MDYEAPLQFAGLAGDTAKHPYVVAVVARTYSSGILLDSKHVLTCDHACRTKNPEDRVVVVTSSSAVEAAVIWSNGEADLAVLLLDHEVPAPSLRFSDTSFYAGESLTAVGIQPAPASNQLTVTSTVLSCMNACDAGNVVLDIQLKGGAREGYSGGPVLQPGEGISNCVGIMRLGGMRAATSNALTIAHARALLAEQGLHELLPLTEKTQPEMQSTGSGRRTLLASLALLLAILAIAAGLVYVRRHPKKTEALRLVSVNPAPAKPKILIIVAGFDSPNAQKYRFSETIYEYLQAATANYDDIEIATDDQVITEAGGTNAAITLGKKRHADAVIWGFHGGTSRTPLKVSVEAMDDDIPLGNNVLNYYSFVPLARIESGESQREVAEMAASLAMFVSGWSRMRAYNFHGAIDIFTDVLRNQKTLRQIASASGHKEFLLSLYLNRAFSRSSVFDIKNAFVDLAAAMALAQDEKERSAIFALRAFLKSSLLHHHEALAECSQLDSFKEISKSAYLLCAVAEQRSGSMASSRIHLARALPGPEPTGFDQYMQRGNTYRLLCNFEEARKDLQTAITLDPSQPDAHLALGELYQGFGNVEAAEIEFAKGISLAPSNPEGYFLRMDMYRENFKFDLLARDADRVRKLAPDAGAMIAMTAAGFKPAAAASVADFGGSDDRMAPFLLATRGDLLLKAGKLDEADSLFKKAIQGDRNLIMAYVGRSTVLEARNRIPEAFKILYDAIRIQPRAVLAHYQLGRLDLGRNDFQSAVKDFGKAVELISDPNERPYEFPGLHPGTCRPEIDLIRKYTESMYRANRAKALLALHRDSEALAELTKAEQLYPTHPAVHHVKSVIAASKNDYADALAHINISLADDPDDPVFNDLKGDYLLNLGNYDAAIESYSRALAQVPDQDDVLCKRGLVYVLAGKLQLAATDFDRALDKNPANAQALHGRAGIRIQEGKFDQAITDMTIAVHLEPTIPAYYVRLGDAYLGNDDDQAALKAYKQALKLAPDNDLIKEMIRNLESPGQ